MNEWKWQENKTNYVAWFAQIDLDRAASTMHIVNILSFSVQTDFRHRIVNIKANERFTQSNVMKISTDEESYLLLLWNPMACFDYENVFHFFSFLLLTKAKFIKTFQWIMRDSISSIEMNFSSWSTQESVNSINYSTSINK